jgi:hypothetical protein
LKLFPIPKKITVKHSLNYPQKKEREKKGSGEISFTGSKQVKTIEEEFERIFGLYVQICYTSKEGNRYYTSGSEDSKSLTALNREKEAAGCMKDVWK